MFIPRDNGHNGFTSYAMDGCRPKANGLRCYSYAAVLLPASATRMCENDVLVNMKAVNSHRVTVSVTVSRGTVLSLCRRRLQITGSSIEWETCCCMLIANWKWESY